LTVPHQEVKEEKMTKTEKEQVLKKEDIQQKKKILKHIPSQSK
jgi:hypothetical protein